MLFSHGSDDGGPIRVSSSSRVGTALSQVAIHESGHCVIGRYFGLPIGSVTIVPSGLFGGRVLAPSADPNSDSVEVAHRICDVAIAKMPKPGEDQEPISSWHIYVKNRIIELLAGTIAEEIYDPKVAKLPCGNDIKTANIFAESICPDAAVPYFIDYCKIETREILKDNWKIVTAIAEELDTEKTLSGTRVDLIISESVSKSQIAAEIDRRARWRKLPL